MKHILWGAAFVVVSAACGGGSKAPREPEPPAKSACAVAAENLAGVLMTVQEIGLKPEQQPDLVRIFTERCETDAWSDAAVACMTNVKAGPEHNADLDACGDMLTDEQEEAAKAQLQREVIPQNGEMMEAPADSAPPTRGAPAGGGAPPPDDPCGGGA
jgi:hypothetical protein